MATIDQKYLKECMTFDPETKEFTWKERPAKHFKDGRMKNGKRYPKERIQKSWNGNYAGKVAGSWHTQGFLVFTIDMHRYKEPDLIDLYLSEDEKKTLKGNG